MCLRERHDGNKSSNRGLMSKPVNPCSPRSPRGGRGSEGESLLLTLSWGLAPPCLALNQIVPQCSSSNSRQVRPQALTQLSSCRPQNGLRGRLLSLLTQCCEAQSVKGTHPTSYLIRVTQLLEVTLSVTPWRPILPCDGRCAPRLLRCQASASDLCLCVRPLLTLTPPLTAHRFQPRSSCSASIPNA